MKRTHHPVTPPLCRAAVWAAVAAATFVVACNSHHKLNAPMPVTTVIADSLVFTRPDSTEVLMGATPLVCCGLYDPGFVNERAMRIALYDPANQKAGWQILILTDRAQAGAMVTPPPIVVAPSKVPAGSEFPAPLGRWGRSDTDPST